MRSVSVGLQVVAVVAVFTVSVVGQEVFVSLPIEPVHETWSPSLADAAQRNDFPMFDALYSASPDRAYAELHAFWKWSLTDSVGGFYGADLHAKFAAEYPDYAAFIADHEIVDARGNVFYPSSETRQFLLRHVNMTPRRVPVLSVEKPVSSPARPRASAVIPKHEKALAKPVVKLVAKAVAKPVAAEGGGAPLVVLKPAPPVVATIHVAKPVADHIDDARFARGLALIIAGLIGVGMLTVMLRAPADGKAPQSDPESHSSVA